VIDKTNYMTILIECIGWLGSLLIVGSYALNLKGKLPATDKRYIWANLIGGACFAIHTYVHGAYPSVVVNIIWIFFAVDSLFRKQKK
jgi:purine-cytosine permease-like protein